MVKTHQLTMLPVAHCWFLKYWWNKLASDRNTSVEMSQMSFRHIGSCDYAAGFYETWMLTFGEACQLCSFIAWIPKKAWCERKFGNNAAYWADQIYRVFLTASVKRPLIKRFIRRPFIDDWILLQEDWPFKAFLKGRQIL